MRSLRQQKRMQAYLITKLYEYYLTELSYYRFGLMYFCLHYTITVSYTHLDVYKRQTHDSSRASKPQHFGPPGRISYFWPKNENVFGHHGTECSCLGPQATAFLIRIISGPTDLNLITPYGHHSRPERHHCSESRRSHLDKIRPSSRPETTGQSRTTFARSSKKIPQL